MNLPNDSFREFPIEFKKINVDDFPDFDVEEKIILEVDDGYIGDSFIENISISESNTVVLNCGVGSGKTTAVIKAVKEFYDREEYVIFIASPFVSLVQQYFLDVQEKAHISEDKIYRNEWIGERSQIAYVDKKVHIVTINTLLGNPGEDGLINSLSKREYLNDMVSYCESNNKKVIFVFDEIHDSIHNFKEKYIFNLWKWRNVVHKNFVISATYSEASKIVIEYLAELTHNRIRILEAERVRVQEKLSELYLYYDNAKGYSNENGNLIGIVENVFKRGLDLDILCFSKKLCESIISSTEQGVGKLIFDKYGENINNCTSGLDDNARTNRDVHENRYNKEKCNIGTNFKSGVSIEKDNHAFVLIFPPVSARGDFKNGYGIFSGGVNSIIQSLARKRKKGEIHILLPRPTKFDFNSFPFNESQRLIFKQHFESIQYQEVKANSDNGIIDKKTIDYIPLESQNELISNFYFNEFKANVQDSISHLQSIKETRLNKIRLEFPEFKLFKLEYGEQYLANKYKFFGSDLSGYLSYAAVTNQFVNCDLVGTNWKPTQNFKIGRLQYYFEKFYENYFSDDWFYSLKSYVSDLYVYHEIRNEIFSNYSVKLFDLKGNSTFIKPYQDKIFEQQLVAFIQRKLFRENKEFVKRFEDGSFVKDDEYSRGDYFRACISHANILLLESENHVFEVRELIRAYVILNKFRQKILDTSIVTIKKGTEIRYVLTSPPDDFVLQHEMMDFILMFGILIKKDIFIANEIFEFKRAFERTDDKTKAIKSFYTYLLNDFFFLKDDYVYPNKKQTRIKIIKEIEIPNHKTVINFILAENTNYPESYSQSETKINEFEEIKKALNPD